MGGNTMDKLEKIFDDRKGRKCIINRCDYTSCEYNKHNQCTKPMVSLGRRGECKDYEPRKSRSGTETTYKR